MSQQLSSSEVKEVWQTARAQLELELSSGVYNAWIVPCPLTQLEVDESSARAVVTAPSAFHSLNLKQKLGVQVEKVLSGVLGKTVLVDYQVGDPTIKRTADSSANSATNSPTNSAFNQNQPQNQSQPNHQASSNFQNSIPTPSHSPSPRVEDLFSQSNLESAEKNQAEVRARSIGLRSDYTFTTFAVSSSNEMAHAAATAVSNHPGGAYNPLFLYGGVGVGKTHLMHAIGHNILEQKPNTKIIYCTGEEFTNQIVGAIRNKNAIEFKERFRKVDILLIDDIQFIAGKNTVQEEFFHTFNALTKRSSQIVLTSDRPPHEMSLLESRLKSRFEAGLMIDIQQPSFELRTAILLIKSKALNLPIPIEMAKMIAARVDSARKIEGILNSLRSAIELRGQELSPELIERTLVAEADQRRPNLNVQIKDIIKIVADHFHLKQNSIKGKTRKKNITKARHIAMFLAKEDLNEPYAEIGNWFSNRDHTTVMHAVNKISEHIELDEALKQEVSAIRMTLSGLK